MSNFINSQARQMFEKKHIQDYLIKSRNRSQEMDVLSEAGKILKKDLFSGKKILDNLGEYSKLSACADEEDLPGEDIFSLKEIKDLAVLYRLKFLESKYYKPEMPYEARLKIDHLNLVFHKEIRDSWILSVHDSFSKQKINENSVLFVRTNYDNYYLVHAWGNKLPAYRRLLFWPLRRFETLILTVALVTLIIDLLLPTRFITLDHKATYWSGYRAAAFFHLLIFNAGVTVYFTFAFAKNFSSTVWNRYKDFG